MKSVLITAALVMICLIGSYYLSQYWIPLGFIGFFAAFGIIGASIYGKNRRIQ